MRVCAESGCPTLTASTYCDHHTKAKRQQSDKRRPNAKQRGYGARWAKFSKAFLKDRPWCEDELGCGERATVVDHIDGKGPLGERGFDPSNCRPLCARHHNQRTARDQPGGWNA